MRPLRVLVFSATYGAGHVKAAEALIAAIRINDSEVEIIHEDAIALINKGLNHLLRSSYIGLIKHAPKIWGKFYYRTQEIADDSLLQCFLNTFGRRHFVKYGAGRIAHTDKSLFVFSMNWLLIRRLLRR